MAKVKLFSGKKKCPDGDVYKFRKGIANVPGCLFAGQPMKININEFRKILKEIENDNEQVKNHSSSNSTSSSISSRHTGHR